MSDRVLHRQALLRWWGFEHEDFADKVFVHAPSAARNVLVGEIVKGRGVQAAVIDDYVFCGCIDALNHCRRTDDALDNTFIEQLDDVLLQCSGNLAMVNADAQERALATFHSG